MSMLLSVHIAAGGIAIILGAVALIARKGGFIHRRAGLLFVCAMLTLGISAALLGFRKSPTDPNVFGGLMTIYFVVTALATVRPLPSWITAVGMIVASVLAVFDVFGGMKALGSPRLSFGGAPFFMLFILATVMSLAAIGDLRVLRFGLPAGGKRLARHLWRMCFALFIAAGSFFSIRARVAKVLPAPFTTPLMRALPIVLLFGAMFYWLWRVRRREAHVVLLERAPREL